MSRERWCAGLRLGYYGSISKMGDRYLRSLLFVGRDGAVVVGDKRDEIHGVLSVDNIKCFQQK
jgi:transposase